MKSIQSGEKQAEAGVTIFQTPQQVLASFELASRGLKVATQAIRERSAPPDGRTRTELPMHTSEAAQLLGVSATTLKRLEAEMQADGVAGAEFVRGRRGQRVFYSQDMYRMRRYLKESLRPPTEAPHTLAIVNQKGGVGKTTTALNFAMDAATRGHRVLVIDADPQASGTTSLLVDRGDGTLIEGSNLGLTEDHTIASVLLGDTKDIRPLIRKTHWPTIDIVPSSPDLVDGEFSMIIDYADSKMENRPAAFWTGLRVALQRLTAEEYDLVIIDCAPSLNLSTLATLLASEGLLIPCPMRSLDVESLHSFVNTTFRWLSTLSQVYPVNVRWWRVLPTMRQASITEETNELTVRTYMGTQMLPGRMPRMEALQRAAGGAATVFELQREEDLASAGAAARKARAVLRSVHNDIFTIIRAAAAAQKP